VQKLEVFNLLQWEKKHFLVRNFFWCLIIFFTMKLENLFKYWAASYFLDSLTVLTALIGFIIFVLKKKKENIAYNFLYYFIAYIFLKSIFFVHPLLPDLLSPQEWFIIEELADYIFTLLEFLIFYNFFRKVLNFSFHKKILTIIFYVFIISGCSILFYNIVAFDKVQISFITFLFNMQAISLLVPSIFYYIEIFKSKPILNLFRDGSFWIVTGLSFFMITTLPSSLLLNSFYKSNVKVFLNTFFLFYIFYIILFSMIIRAYLCNPKTIK
jgi:hypothetical protein